MRIRSEIEALERSLLPVARPERATGEKRYLKSRFDFLGVSTPQLRRLTKAWLRAHPDLNLVDLRRLSRALFSRRIHELKAVAILFLEYRWKLLEPTDLELLEWMLRRSYTWAYVDALAVHVVGPLAERHPGVVATINDWTHDEDFWIRRSALLSLLLPLRRGDGDWDRFAAYADSMLEEREFFIRKAIGWVLRETSKKRPALVSGFVGQHVKRISGVTIREAVKYLPASERDNLLQEYKTRNVGGNSYR